LSNTQIGPDENNSGVLQHNPFKATCRIRRRGDSRKQGVRRAFAFAHDF
jgi:hypothetical protein